MQKSKNYQPAPSVWRDVATIYSYDQRFLTATIIQALKERNRELLPKQETRAEPLQSGRTMNRDLRRRN